MNYFYRDVVLPMMVIGAAILAIIGFIIGFAIAMTALDCAGYERATGKPTRMEFATCYIKEGEQWYSWEELKYRFATKGEIK